MEGGREERKGRGEREGGGKGEEREEDGGKRGDGQVSDVFDGMFPWGRPTHHFSFS